MSLKKLQTIIILLLLASTCTGCASFGGHTTLFLTDKDKVFIVPANAKVPVLWDGKAQELQTGEEMVMLYKGTFIRLQKEANANLLR
jgi:hypothetical protein